MKLRISVWTITAMLLALGGLQAAAAVDYFLADFEEAGGWKPGPLPGTDSPLRVLQGKAEIAKEEIGQVLALGPSEKYPAVFLDASPFAASGVVFCQVLARPVAVEESRDEEFLDFGGAILGCFRVGAQGEIRGLYARSPRENVWISTGIRFDLDADGRPAKWLKIAIRLDRATGTWSVVINGTPAVSALRTVAVKDEAALPFWLYGDPAGVTLFDDLLVSTTEPGEVERTLARPARTDIFDAKKPGQQLVTQDKPTPELRRTQPVIAAVNAARGESSRPVLRGWHLTLDTGRQRLEKDLVHGTKDPGIIAYAPPYDDEGKPLPVRITITADAQLRPGTDLSRLRWQVAEMKGWPDKIGEVIGEGDFRTGLVQTFELSPEWARKATRLSVWTAK